MATNTKKTSKSDKSSNTKVQVKHRYKMADRLIVPYKDEPLETDPSKIKFMLPYQVESKMQTAQCTEEVFDKVNAGNLYRNFDKQYKLFFNDDGVITGFSTYQKNILGAHNEVIGIENPDDPAGSTSAKWLVIEKEPDDNVSVKFAPNSVKPELQDQIREYVESKGFDSVKVGDFLLGRYIVEDIRMGGTLLYVNPVSI